MFERGDRHMTADELHAEAQAAGVGVSLATVYNTLNQFTGAGLLRMVAVESGRTYFDTNTTDHHHFFCEDRGELGDIAPGDLRVVGIPDAPPGTAVTGVDVIVRLRSTR
jgi:Fur family iron response transcriptional regulator